MIWSPILRVDRRRLVLVLGVVCALPAGILVGLAPATALILTAVALSAVACLAVPLRQLPALLLAITVVMPTLVFEGIGGSGQARAVALVLVLALGRLLMQRTRIAAPRILALAIGAALGLTLITALVASTRPASEVGGTADLVRDLSYPAAAAVGFIGAASARSDGRLPALTRSLAWLSLLAALLSVWYWGWHALGVPALSSGLFGQILGTTGFGGSRSIFPFVEDSPNVGAVIFILLAAFTAPPMIWSGARRDRLLGLGVIVASTAAVLCTQSRTGLFASAAAALTYVLLIRPRRGRGIALALTLLLGLGAGVTAYATFPAERGSTDTLQARVHIWGQAWHAFLADPLLGHGYEYSLKGNFVEGDTVVSVSHVQSTHSDVISALVDGGVVGAAIFIAILGLMVIVARTALADPRVRPIGIGYSCMLAAFVVGGLDNTLTQSAASVTIVWMAFGIAVGAVGATWIRAPHVRQSRRLRAGRPGGGHRGTPRQSNPATICAE